MALHPAYSAFKKIPCSGSWFEIFQISNDHYIFYEDGHYEEAIINLIIGNTGAILIDSGCGIGNLRKEVEAITNKEILLVNTHTHLDHIGGNNQFENTAMFDHPKSRLVAESGVSNELFKAEILADNLINKPFPEGFDPTILSLEPLKVNYWLKDGDIINFGGLKLEVIHTPGEAADHICILDRKGRRLFCGDILLLGQIWTHLEGGSLKELVSSYNKLMSIVNEFDYLMPSHNVPKLDKSLLTEALAATEKVMVGKASFEMMTDPWNRRLKNYSFDGFQIITK